MTDSFYKRVLTGKMGLIITVCSIVVCVVSLLSLSGFFRLGLIEDVPENYYPAVERQSPSDLVTDLIIFLDELALPRKYEVDVFDCSEASAFVEWALEGAGFDARIAATPTHAWVIVYAADGSRVAIETNHMMVITENFSLTLDNLGLPYNHYRPEVEYSDIYDAIMTTRNPEDWDWWQL